MDAPEPEFIDPKNIHPGPIRHESLSDEMLEEVRSIFEIIGPYIEMTLEQFEITLMRDTSPEDEVVTEPALRQRGSTTTSCTETRISSPRSNEKKLLAALIAISTGVEDVEKLGVSAEVGRKLLACYDALEEELE
ncbi:MAG: hypothetical protein WEB58_12860 [Planctomycetaceae bacterium]